MGILDLYQSNEHRNNVAHFAAIVTIALADGELNEAEMKLVNRFAKKLDIRDDEYDLIIENPTKYPLVAYSSYTDRVEHLFDLFKIIYSDHSIDEQERKLINRYAIGLGFSADKAGDIVKKSIAIFETGINFEYYSLMLGKTTV